MKKKMYLVKREVLATDIKKAMRAPGKIYSIELADERHQPTDNKPLGFKIK